MNIGINILDSHPKKRNNVLVVKGEIYIGNFKEILYIPLDWWSLNDYKKQWEEGVARLITHDTSCLVAAIHNPHIRPYINWWLLYKADSKIYVRNQLLIEDIYLEHIGNQSFTIETCYNFIPPKGDKYDEDGDEISEWSVNWNYEFH